MIYTRFLCRSFLLLYDYELYLSAQQKIHFFLVGFFYGLLPKIDVLGSSDFSSCKKRKEKGHKIKRKQKDKLKIYCISMYSLP